MPLKNLREFGEEINPKGTHRDVQTTSFGIDGLARYICNTPEEVDAAAGTKGFDIVVIGSGMYGSYIASKLLEFGSHMGGAAPRAVVLEAGPFLISEHVQNLTALGDVGSLVEEPIVGPNTQFKIDEPGDFISAKTFRPHHKCVGGKSLFWGGWTPRMSEDDLRAADSPWPGEVVDYLFNPDGYTFVENEIGTKPDTDFITSSDLFDKVLARAKTAAAATKVAGGVALQEPYPAPIAVQAEAPASGLFSFDKFSSLPLLTDALRNSGGSDPDRRLFLVPNAEALRIVTAKGVVRGVRYAVIDRLAHGVPNDRNGPKPCREIRTLTLNPGGSVIIAGNTINSTRLALNSFRRPRGLGPAELMGANLMVHVRGNHVWQVKSDALGLLPSDKLGTTALHVPGVSRVIDQAGRQRRGRFHFQFYAAAGLQGDEKVPENPEAVLYRMLPNFDQVETLMAAQSEKVVAVGIRSCGETFGDRSGAQIGDANSKTSWMDTAPPGLADELFVDAGGAVLERVPRAFVRLVQTPGDEAVRSDQKTAAFEFMTAFAGAKPGDAGGRPSDAVFLATDAAAPKIRYRSESKNEEDGIGSTYHECGTLWMGDDPTTSVTDVHARFHHVANAYCVDQSIFPTADSANPVPTGITLARKAAHGLIRRYMSAPLRTVEPGFTELYAGDLSAWRIAKQGAANFFAIDEEAPLISAGRESEDVALGVIYLPQQFKDFELRLQWRIFSPLANGGIFLRAPVPSDNQDLGAAGGFYEQALEVQIDETGFDPAANEYGIPLRRTGALYGKLPATRWCAKAASRRNRPERYWNDYRIRIEGAEITVSLNDEIVCSGPHRAALAQGVIGLQCHTEVVQYRSIQIKEL